MNYRTVTITIAITIDICVCRRCLEVSLTSCMFSQNYSQNVKLNTFYKVLTTSSDGKMEFISTIEGKRE